MQVSRARAPSQPGAIRRFEPDSRSAGEARRFVAATLESWRLERFVDDAATCAAELCANAVLHARSAFTVSLRTIARGVRLDVVDDRPDRLPLELPRGLGPLESGTTGRGLLIVASVASRWGFFTTDVAKTVWTEHGADRGGQLATPVIELAARPGEEDSPLVSVVDLPVAAAVESGVQVDDLVRELQLDPTRLDTGARQRFFELLDRSAALRLIGRQRAFAAAAEGRDRVTVELRVDPGELEAMAQLVELLEQLTRYGSLEAAEVSPAVAAMRAWLPGEVAAQLRGRAPTPYPHGSA